MSEASTADARLVDVGGRELGPRARNTREKLLEATAQLLEQQSLRDLRVVEIARVVGTSAATFYQYFRDVEEAVLALASQATAEMPAIVALIDGEWEGSAGLDRARRLVDAFIAHWDSHQAVLRVRNLASDEGDARFMRVRTEAMTPVLDGLARQFSHFQKAGAVSANLHPHSAAAAMASILERLAAYHRELELVGVTRDELVETSARILHQSVTGSEVA